MEKLRFSEFSFFELLFPAMQLFFLVSSPIKIMKISWISRWAGSDHRCHRLTVVVEAKKKRWTYFSIHENNAVFLRCNSKMFILSQSWNREKNGTRKRHWGWAFFFARISSQHKTHSRAQTFHWRSSFQQCATISVAGNHFFFCVCVRCRVPFLDLPFNRIDCTGTHSQDLFVPREQRQMVTSFFLCCWHHPRSESLSVCFQDWVDFHVVRKLAEFFTGKKKEKRGIRVISGCSNMRGRRFRFVDGSERGWLCCNLISLPPGPTFQFFPHPVVGSCELILGSLGKAPRGAGRQCEMWFAFDDIGSFFPVHFYNEHTPERIMLDMSGFRKRTDNHDWKF